MPAGRLNIAYRLDETPKKTINPRPKLEKAFWEASQVRAPKRPLKKDGSFGRFGPARSSRKTATSNSGTSPARPSTSRARPSRPQIVPEWPDQAPQTSRRHLDSTWARFLFDFASFGSVCARNSTCLRSLVAQCETNSSTKQERDDIDKKNSLGRTATQHETSRMETNFVFIQQAGTGHCYHAGYCRHDGGMGQCHHERYRPLSS